MRVCFITFEYPPKVLGGLGVYADQLVGGLRKKGIDVLTVTRGDRNEYRDKVVRILTPDISYWRRFFFINKSINLFHRLNKSWKFDLVHLNGAYPIMQGLKLPTVCTFHSTNPIQLASGLRSLRSIKTLRDQTSLLLRNPVGTLSDIFSARLSNRIICPSPSIANELQSHCFVKREKINIIPNGVDIEAENRVEAADVSLLERYGVEREKFVLFVGRLTHLKGVNYLVDAFRIVRKEYRDIKLVIAGNGPSMPYLRHITEDLSGVVFVGRISSRNIMRLLYESCFVVVVPSIHDTLPTVILEAMMRKKPIIATNVGGNPVMVKNGENGFLVAPRDSKSLSQSIKMLYQNPDLGKKMGASGRKMLEKSFSCEKMVTETLKVYETLLSQSAPS